MAGRMARATEGAHGPAAFTRTRARHSMVEPPHSKLTVTPWSVRVAAVKFAGMANSPPSERAESTTARVSSASSVCAS